MTVMNLPWWALAILISTYGLGAFLLGLALGERPLRRRYLRRPK